jgi:hypothetical protein
MLAVVRWFVKSVIPQSFTVTLHGQTVGVYKQHFNLFAEKLTIDLSRDTDGMFDRRLALAAGILLCAIEGRRD